MRIYLFAQRHRFPPIKCEAGGEGMEKKGQRNSPGSLRCRLNLTKVINSSESSADVCVSFWDVNVYGWHSEGIFIQQNKQLRDKKLKSCWILSD
jgi:hypothetical protein